MAHTNVHNVDEVRARGARSILVQIGREFVGLRRQAWGNAWGYLFIAPAVILYLVFQAWPILRGRRISHLRDE